MNIKLVSLTYLITLVTCGTSGKAKISTHYYDVDLPRLGTNPVFCGYKGSHMDINRIAAVQSLTLNECGACLKVTAKNGKFVYVMAVDKSGFGLDLNKKSFIQLFGINTGRFDAKWEKTEAIHCKGILKGGNYKTPGLNGSDKGKGGKKKLDINEIENKKVSNDVDNITKHTFRRMRPNSVKEKAKKDNKNNVERKYHEYESNGREDLKHINHIDYRKKSDKDKSKKDDDKDKSKKDNDKDQKKEKPKKDNKKKKPQKKDSITKDNKKEPEEIKDNQENQIFELSEYTRGDVIEVYFGDD